MPSRPPRWPRALGLAALFLLALAFRLGYQSQMAQGPLWERPVLDEAFNHAWAERLARGEPGPREPYFRAPLYPWLMGLVYRAAGPRPEAVRTAQAVLSSLCCLLLFFLTRDVFGEMAGWSAGALGALYWPWAYFDGELQDVPLTLFLDLAALACLARPAGARGGGAWRAAAGLLLGLSAIARPTVLAAVPAVLLWIAWDARRAGVPVRRAVLRSVLVAAAVLVPILPVTAVNVLRGGDAVLIASQGGMNFYIGNNPDSDGHSARFPGESPEWEALREAARSGAERAAGRELRASEISRHWFAEGLRFWVAEPAGAVRLTLRKVGFLLTAPELPNNKQIRFFTTTYSPLMRIPWPGFGLVAPLALVGLLWGRGGRSAALLAAFASAYGLAVVAFFVAARFRMPFAAVGIVLAGGGCAALLRIARRPPRRWIAPLGVLGVATLLVHLPVLGGYRENVPHAHYTLGNALRDAGDLEGASREYREAVRGDPGLREARRNLGATLLALGRPGEAVAELQEGVALDPDDLGSRLNYALALAQVGEPAAARRELEAVVHRDPLQAEAWVALGNLDAADGDQAAAAAAFERALQAAPRHATARFNLGNAFLALGRIPEAETAYRDLLAAHPGHVAGRFNLAALLARSGRIPEATAELERVLAGAPAGSPLEAQARAALDSLDGSQ